LVVAGTLIGDPSRKLLLRIGIANVGYAQALYLGLLILLPGRVAVIGQGHKTVLLAVVAAAGALIALPAGIVAGRASDRRLESVGARRPVLLAGAAVGAALLIVLPFTRSVAALLTAWCGAQIGLNVVFVMVTAALVDWFPTGQRGRASAYAAGGQVAGALIASGVTFSIGGHLAAVGALCGALLVLTALPAALLPPAGPAALGRSLASVVPPGPAPAPGDYRDAGLAWAVRVVVTFANTLVFTFANFYVTDVLHLRSPQRFVGLVAAVTAVLVLVGAVYAGRASDRAHRRRRYVIGAVGAMCLGEVLLAAWPAVPGVLTACALVGLGYGVYLSVDQALTADVLPRPRAYGRDIGVMNAAISVPQVAAPALAALLLGASAGYAVLFSVGALITLSGAGFVVPIRRVR
jgi:MFS family permease